MYYSALIGNPTEHGINVTLPHKLAVMPYLDFVDPVVEQLGAVNTISLKDGAKGYNTDWTGIYQPIKNLAAKVDCVTIFGSGGAARAAIYAAKELGASKVNVLYRNEKDNYKTNDLMERKDELSITMLPYDDLRRVVEDSDLIINATSAGMVGQDASPFDLRLLNELDVSAKIYLDAVFNPLETPLLQLFKKNGAKTIDGLWMMIFQGVAALAIWLDRDVKIASDQLESIHQLLAKELLHA
ncbi:MAG: shikimate dehydrogenase [Candidatus Saccharibacteria bacterium]|nr:shikimate dehydrogenase [Candidatus Saccharibacteria bacterium]